MLGFTGKSSRFSPIYRRLYPRKPNVVPMLGFTRSTLRVQPNLRCFETLRDRKWIPAFAGMTAKRVVAYGLGPVEARIRIS